MLEIRIHGRGGQGNVMAAYLLATTAINEGREAQAFPSFGAERRGAPVTAFVRIADAPIRRRCQVQEPHFLIIQADPALLHVPGVTTGLRAGGAILADGSPEPGFDDSLDCPIVRIQATRLAVEHLAQSRYDAMLVRPVDEEKVINLRESWPPVSPIVVDFQPLFDPSVAVDSVKERIDLGYDHGFGRGRAGEAPYSLLRGWDGKPGSNLAPARNLLRYGHFYQGSAQTPAPTTPPRPHPRSRGRHPPPPRRARRR